MARSDRNWPCANGCGRTLRWGADGVVEAEGGAVHACPRRLVAAYLPPCPRCGEPVCRLADGTLEDRPREPHACVKAWRPSLARAS